MGGWMDRSMRSKSLADVYSQSLAFSAQQCLCRIILSPIPVRPQTGPVSDPQRQQMYPSYIYHYIQLYIHIYIGACVRPTAAANEKGDGEGPGTARRTHAASVSLFTQGDATDGQTPSAKYIHPIYNYIVLYIYIYIYRPVSDQEPSAAGAQRDRDRDCRQFAAAEDSLSLARRES
jgi:hypothetical protein